MIKLCSQKNAGISEAFKRKRGKLQQHEHCVPMQALRRIAASSAKAVQGFALACLGRSSCGLSPECAFGFQLGSGFPILASIKHSGQVMASIP